MSDAHVEVSPQVGDDKNTVRLLVNGQDFTGWEEVEIFTSFEHLATVFRLRMTEFGGVFLVVEGDRCQVVIGTDLVVTGWVDAVTREISAQAHLVEVQGRDLTCDLVDCCAELDGGHLTGQNIHQIANTLASRYAVPVDLFAGPGEPFGVVAVHPGETNFALLERLARQRGLLLTSDPEGDLRITKPGKEISAGSLIEGENVLSAKYTRSLTERYSVYLVLGQSHLTDESAPQAAFGQKGQARDYDVTRYRNQVVVAEAHGDDATMDRRAAWEAAVRSGRGQALAVLVPGWKGPDDVLWRPNALVRVEIPTLGIDDTLLLAACRYTLDKDGTRTELTLYPQDAFDPAPYKLGNKSKSKKQKGAA
ncbi:MAG: hypothetical protein OEV94_11765 [Deltaproteobacteria bacterium]|nr:hypothetical protein [Deltaproteobacteria bacterium]